LALLIYTRQQVKAKQLATKKAQFLLNELHPPVKKQYANHCQYDALASPPKPQDPSVSSVLVDNKLRLETFAVLNQHL
jgi:hypothetical protein